MFDREINKSIKKGIKIGKWVIGISAITNFAVWAIIGMCAYKYLYIDYVASRYQGSESEKQIIEEKLKFVTFNIEKGFNEISKNKPLNYANQLVRAEYEKDLTKDEFGRAITKRCTNIEEDLVNRLVEEKSSFQNNFQIYESKKNQYINNYYIHNGFLKDKNNCNNVDFQVISKFVSKSDENQKYDTHHVEKLSINVHLYNDNIVDNETLDVKLHRKYDYAKLYNYTDEVAYYHYKTGTIVVVHKKTGIIDIYYSDYIKEIFDLAVKYWGDPLVVISGKVTNQWERYLNDKKDKEKAKIFYEEYLPNTNNK